MLLLPDYMPTVIVTALYIDSPSAVSFMRNCLRDCQYGDQEHCGHNQNPEPTT